MYSQLMMHGQNIIKLDFSLSLCLPVSLNPVPDYEWSQYTPAYIPFARNKILGVSYYHFCFVKRGFLCNRTLFHTLKNFLSVIVA